MVIIFGQSDEVSKPIGKISLLFYKISQGIEKLIREKGAKTGLSGTQVRAIIFLADAHRNSRGVSSVARHLEIAQPTATRVIDSLEEKGLVERTRREDDRRKVRIDLTEEGRDRALEFTDVSRSLEKIIGTLPEEHVEVLDESLTEIVGVMQQKGQLSASLTCKYCRFFEPNDGGSEERPHHCKLTGEDLSEEESRQEWVHSNGNLRLINNS